MVGMEGKVVELSWYGEKEVSLNLGGDFHLQRKQIISSQVSRVPYDKSARWDYKRRKEVVLKLLKNSIFDSILTNEINFEDAPAFFNSLRTRDGYVDKGLGWTIRYK